MSEFDSPNYAEFSYTRKSEGSYKTKRMLLIGAYVLFVVAFFIVVLTTKLIPVFAICPIVLWILIFFTWRYVSYDYYFEFREGNLQLGKIMGTKNGRKKYPMKKVHIKEALFIAPYDDAEAKERIIEAKRVYDYSESQASDTVALIFEGTAKMAKLCASFCENSKNMKGQIMHG